ncbi:ATP-dependent DNA helicase [Pseudorhodoferax sp.]|uniref:ATP-dependent DNA helicase n=1 Tax=Pseudorhodoferax sp. TaxID=1993553 RepID=UPI002DD68DE8|nr:ATP-dependent DNA helicase [Pseudorhodoferax sp.]
MHYTVAVRALCEFTAKAGDLDLRFTPAPTALEGIAGHALVTGRREPHYESEVSLQGSHGDLLVRGRADGFDPACGRLEEIKTHRGDLAHQPAQQRALHWAQLKVYGWLLCAARGLPAVTLALVYFDIASQRETVFEERHDATALRGFFEDQCTRFLAWAAQEQAHRVARDSALAQLGFPHPQFRPGQRALAEAVYRAATRGRPLLAQAPTGIGKTVGTLFPLLKACPGKGIDKLFYLAAKTPGRQLALDALARIAPSGQPLRVLELVAREKSCEHPDKACHGESCPLARGFYDRLPAARSAAVAAGPLDRATLRGTALAHQVCPYYLGQELARWADVVVGDYNYWFDGSAMLYALAQQNEWRVAVLVDEAHNLVDRGRAMYSAGMQRGTLRALRHEAPAALRRPLDRLDRQWRAVLAEDAADYSTRAEPPAGWTAALQDAAGALGEYFAERAPGAPHALDAALQTFWFEALQFLRLAQSFGTHSMVDVTRLAGPGRGRNDAELHIRNLIPAEFLAPRLAAAWSSTLFSATLAPPGFYRDTLGLPADAPFVDIDSPYAAGQLRVHVAGHISTRFAERQASAAPIAALIAAQYHAQPGNYLAFFSSHDYLELVATQFAQAHPDLPHWRQARRMDEAERQAFVARFVPGGAGIGFAVLGGSFGEGIDLPGDRLIGAFIATLGLPQINPVNEEMRRRMQQSFGAGYDYAYLYPGLRKVVQAAGRVIRSREDRGVVVLIDTRFGRRAVQALLPRWWQLA